MRKMIDSGIEWIGKIPESWSLRRLQWCLKEVNDSNNPIKTTQVLSLTNTLGVVPYEEKGNQGNKAKENYAEYKIAYENTLVVNSMNVIIGSVGISRYYGCVSPVYYVFRETENADLRFVNYIFNTTAFQKELRKYAKGILEIRLRISASDLFKRTIPLPPKDEQESIAAFLDKECSEIDVLISRTKDSIAEYKKLKQAVITQAVTKGIRGERPMCSCEYIWINQYPADWSVVQLKNYATLRSGITLGKKYPYGTKIIEVPYLRVANVQGDYIDTTDVATMGATEEEVEKYSLKANELLMTEGGDRDKLGRGSIWHGEISPCLHQNHIFAVTTDENKLRVRFLDYVTSAEPARIYFDLTAKKTTNLACTNSTTIMRFRFAVPSIDEQDEIVAYLDEKCVHLNALITQKEQVLKELESLKKTLIYEYVTGKKEVPVEQTAPVVTFIDARALLVCRIVELMKPKGRIHLQKAMHMVDCLLGLNNETQYSRHKHGPYDVRIQEYEQTAEKKGWIKVKQGSSVEYSAGAKIEEYRDTYLSLYGDVDAEIQRICTFLAPMKTSQSERVATLLAAWNDFLLEGVTPTDQQLIQEVRTNWTPNKANSPEATWQDTLNKIRNNGFVPKGKGKHTITER